MTALAVAAPSSSPFGAGRARLKASGLTLTVAAMRPDEAILPVDLLCSRARPRRTPYREWREFYEPTARRVVQTHDVLVASSEYQGTRVALGLLLVTAKGAVRIVYVKLAHRGNGIGLALLEAAGVSLPVPVVEAERTWQRWAEYHGLPWRIAA